MKKQVVPHDDWLEARVALLEEEKKFTRYRDELTQKRQALPWEKVEKEYVFDGPGAQLSLADLFQDRSQLIVYHFMFGPDWDEGCPSCSFLADHYEPSIIHLAHRDVSFVTVSRAPLVKIEAYRQRMGWDFLWVSSSGSDFNWDYNVSFTDDEHERGSAYYNYRPAGFPSSEAPGASVFYRDEEDTIYHTYSVYERGLDMFITAYHYLDIVPKGRDEAETGNMGWLRRHDAYDD